MIRKNEWSPKAKSLAKELHSELRLNDQNWHALKGNPDKRAAELFSAAMVQLLSEGKLSDVQALIEQGILWLKRDIRDPGCPHH